jgi:molybdenum cofactor cytidylyltransferase
MGRTKALLDVGGRPMLQHVLDAAEAAGLDDVIVVLGHDAAAVWAAMRPGPRTRVARNAAFAEGQSTSLRAGLEATTADTDAAVFLLGDQPETTVEAITALVEAFREGRGDVLQARYGDGWPGHPVLLARGVWADAVPATGADRGARDLLDEATPVDVPGDGPPADVDDEDAYRRLLERWDRPGSAPAR